MNQTILTLSCPDTPGIVAAVSGFLAERGCNIVQSAQFRDADSSLFFMRVLFTGAPSATPAPGPATTGPLTAVGGQSGGGASHHTSDLEQAFDTVARRFGMAWQWHDATERPRVLLMVSKFGHCMNDLLFRWSSGQLAIDIPAIVSNHTDFQPMAHGYRVPYFYMPVTAATKADQEARLFELIERERIELVVLARYMQVLSGDLCEKLRGRAINIHHSFLPSFKGAKPYHQAHHRGVKLIGATAHYVTANLDEGPIIEQDVARVDHAMDPAALAAVGHDVESQVLARAVKWHVERRVLLNAGRTVIFR